MTITNNDRASLANTGLSAFANEAFSPGAEEDQTIMGDLLCNIRHLADAQGWDVETMWANSADVHAVEVAEDGGKADANFASGGEEA